MARRPGLLFGVGSHAPDLFIIQVGRWAAAYRVEGAGRLARKHPAALGLALEWLAHPTGTRPA
jgi:hypothetical protein